MLGALKDGDNSTGYMSGTSMAAPHVAGLAAYFVGLWGGHTLAQMRERIVSMAGRVGDARGWILVAFNGAGKGGVRFSLGWTVGVFVVLLLGYLLLVLGRMGLTLLDWV